MITDAQIEAALQAFCGLPHEQFTSEHVSWRSMRAALEAAERAAWQPIETAPNDGTSILVIREGQILMALAYTHVGDSKYAPTHWRPLPDAPKSGG